MANLFSEVLYEGAIYKHGANQVKLDLHSEFLAYPVFAFFGKHACQRVYQWSQE